MVFCEIAFITRQFRTQHQEFCVERAIHFGSEPLRKSYNRHHAGAGLERNMYQCFLYLRDFATCDGTDQLSHPPRRFYALRAEPPRFIGAQLGKSHV